MSFPASPQGVHPCCVVHAQVQTGKVSDSKKFSVMKETERWVPARALVIDDANDQPKVMVMELVARSDPRRHMPLCPLADVSAMSRQSDVCL